LIPLRNIALALLPLLLSTTPLKSQTGAQLRFTYENAKLEPHKYVLAVGEDGSGNYHSEGSVSSIDGQNMSSGSLDRPIHVSKALRESMFAAARKSKFFAKACEDGGKNIAFQGTKTLEYTGPDGQGSCIYNWSKDSQIGKLTDQFQAIAAALDEGSKLQRQYDHGRLSLDSEMEILDQMVRDKRAIEIENIAPLLQTLAGDEAVLQRVQRRAKTLLEAVPSD
jgi:hypothetical protein